jgi:hypothetical protein
MSTPRARALPALLLLAPLSAAARAETRKVVAGEQYAGGAGHRFFFGGDYRDLWTTPVEVEVLDLGKEAGGLTPVRRVGGQQTKGLALKGADGGAYTFRGLEKDPGELLDEDLRGTVVEKLLDDQMAAQHPASELVARGLLAAAGVPVPAWRLVVMPDDPALGEHRAVFAGAIGVFAEYPTPKTDAHPGFLGATAIIDHLTLYKRLASDPAERVDVGALLRARLMDLLMGDWDRHRKQWRWAKLPESPLWTPIPEDRDQAFSRYEGYIMTLARDRDPRFQKFGPKYSGLSGLTKNGFEQDRQLLAGTPRETYLEVAGNLKARITDEVIEQAARRLPSEWYSIDGPRLTQALRARRDALPEIAEKLYLYLAERVDVSLTDRPETIEVRRLPGGDMELVATAAGVGGGAAEPHFRRVLRAKETSEVRLYALGGDDRVVVTGGKGPIKLRVIGGVGDDVLDDSQGGGSRLSDDKGDNRLVKGPGSSHDDRPYEPPPPPKNAPWVPPRDFGSEAWRVPYFAYNSDLGLFLGTGLEKQLYGFRKHPFAASHTFRAGWAFKASTGRADYRGLFPRENSASSFGLAAYASGLETLRFYGLGNETASTGDDDFYKAKEAQYLLYPSYNWSLGKTANLTLGPVLRYSESRTGTGTFIQEAQPYGFGRFGQVAAHAAFVVDGRDNPQYPRRGVVFAVRGTLSPEAWDLEETFGAVGGNLNAYLSGGQWVTLALRGGGRRVFGDYPFRDAAYLGGGGLAKVLLQEPGFTLRGYRASRFGGDGSVYGNSDLRLRLGRITLIVPCQIGVFGLFDVGRVWLKGETSDTWHTSYGGGIWISLLNYRNTLSAYVAHSKEDNIVHVGGGFTF